MHVKRACHAGWKKTVSLELPVPAAHFHSVVLPPSEVSPLTMRFVDSNGRRNLSQNRGSLRCSVPTRRCILGQ